MRTAIIGLAILVAVLGSVNLQAQTQQPATNTAAASVLGGGALPPQPGPPAGATAEFLIAEGNALLAAGYVDAALQDFQRVINLAPDTSSLVSKGWYGLARCYMSQGNQELAKASLEEVLSRNNDPESVNASRDVYKSLKGQADLSVAQVQQTVLYLQWRYQSIPFFSFISKFLAWRDLKSAEKQLEGAQVLANTFNPRYLIAPVQAPAASVLSADGTTVLSATYIPAPSELGTATQGSTISPVTTGSLQPATQPLGNIMSTGPAANAIAPTAGSAPASTPAAPVDDLKAKQEAYLAAYRKLQAAMAANDAAAIQAATKAFQSAMKAYNAARSAVTAP